VLRARGGIARALSTAACLRTVELAVRAVWPAAASSAGGTLLTVRPAASCAAVAGGGLTRASQVFGSGFRHGVACVLSRAKGLAAHPSAAATSAFVSSSIMQCEAPAQADSSLESLSVQLDTSVPLVAPDANTVLHAGGGGGSNSIQLRFAGASTALPAARRALRCS
jgi:hypothetical protein